jgi:hypothetical protein
MQMSNKTYHLKNQEKLAKFIEQQKKKDCNLDKKKKDAKTKDT